MNRWRAVGSRILGLFMLCPIFLVHAGTQCSEQSLTVEQFHSADRLAREVLSVLDRDAREAAILARAGADLSRHGLRYSHAAVVLREAPGTPWRVVHLLNDCGAARASLYRQGLINFFLDDPFEYSALVLVPAEHLQRRLVQEVARGTAAVLLEPRYDMLAHPRSLRAQNSNQWLLELLAAAQAEPGAIDSRAAAQAWLSVRGFSADTVTLSAMERLGATLFKANVSFDGQPAAELRAGRVQVVTVRALERFLLASEAGLLRRELAVPVQNTRIPAVAARPQPARVARDMR